MCLGGSSAPTYRPPPPRVIEPGPASPQDKVNNVEVENINDRSMHDEYRTSNRGPTASGQKSSQSGSKTGRAY